jgi:AAA domain
VSSYEDTASKVDVLARARGIASVMVSAAPEDGFDAEKILLDFNLLPAAEMLAQYRAHMGTFDTLPIDPEGAKVRLYRGEWSIWSGFPGTGKTTFIRQMACRCLQLLKAGECVFIATLEQDPRWYLVEMAATAAGVETATEEQMQSFLDTYGAQLKIWGKIGIASHKEIFATVRHLAKTNGCRHAIIDSLMALDIDSTDNEDQRQFANLVSATARAFGVHIHLVAHPRKPLAPDQAPNVWDIAGASDLGRLAFNVFFIRRGPDVVGFPDISNMLLHVLKQRTSGLIGEQQAYFYRRQRQFHVDQHATHPTRYLPDGVYPETGIDEDVPEHVAHPASFRVEREAYSTPESVSKPWEI